MHSGRFFGRLSEDTSAAWTSASRVARPFANESAGRQQVRESGQRKKFPKLFDAPGRLLSIPCGRTPPGRPAMGTTLREGRLKAMFLANVKTGALVLFGVTALGLCCQAHADEAVIGAVQQDKDLERLATEETRAGELAQELLTTAREAERTARRQAADPKGQRADNRKALADLKMKEAKLRAQFQKQRQALREQLRKLEEQQRKQLAGLKRQRAELSRGPKAPPPGKGGAQAPTGD